MVSLVTAVARRTPISWRLPLYALIGATILSESGVAITAVALPWLVLSVTGSTIWVGAIAASALAPQVIGAVMGGAVVDRMGARLVSIGAGLASCVCITSIALLLWWDYLSMWWLLVLVFMAEFFSIAVATAWESRLPEISRLARVPLERTNAAQEVIQNTALLVGPPLAGFITANMGIKYTVVLIAATSIAFSAINTVVMPRSRRVGQARTKSRGVGFFSETVRVLRTDALLRFVLLLTAALVALLVAYAEVVLPTLFFRTTGDAVGLGFFLSAIGAGGITSAVAFGIWGHRLDQRRIIIGGMVGLVLGTTIIAACSTLPCLLAAGAIIGLAGGPLEPLVNTIVQKRTPAAARGRMMGATLGVVLVAAPLSVLIVGALYELVGAQILLVGTVLALAALTVVTVRSSALRQLRKA